MLDGDAQSLTAHIVQLQAALLRLQAGAALNLLSQLTFQPFKLLPVLLYESFPVFVGRFAQTLYTYLAELLLELRQQSKAVRLRSKQ